MQNVNQQIESSPKPESTCVDAPGPDLMTDDELSAYGLQKTTAFVRREPSAAARRSRRAREKSGAEGIRQVNLTLPQQVHTAMKQLAREMQQGASFAEALQHALDNEAGSLAVSEAALPLGLSEATARLVSEGEMRQDAPLAVASPHAFRVEAGPAVASGASGQRRAHPDATGQAARLSGWRLVVARWLGLTGA